MARTYSSTPVLSKIKIGDSTYYLKDADARGILDAINGDVYESLKLALGTVGGNDSKLVTAANIKSYVDSAVAAIPEFDVVVVQELPTASAETFHKIYLLAASESGVSQNIYMEYITVRSGTKPSYTYSWEKIGDTAIDLSGYVSDVKYVDNTHKLQQQKGNGSYVDVHQFGALADADQGEVDLSDYVKGVSATVTAAGALKKDATNGVQISGSIGAITVIDSVGSAPSFTEGAFTPNTPTAIDVTKFNGGSKAADTFSANTPTVIDTTKFNGGSAASLGSGFYTAGSAASKAADSFTANVPTAIDVTKFSGGSKAADSFTAASLSTVTKALYKQGMKAEVGTGTDAETLVISNVDKEADIKVVDQFSGGSFTEGQFTAASLGNGFYTAGSAASFTEGAFTPNTPAVIDVSKFNGGQAASLNSGFYTAGTAASFTEGAFTAATLGSGFYTAGTAASKVADSWSAGSVPTTKSVTPTFTGDKFAFEGSSVNANVSLTKGGEEVVNPKAE